MSVTDRQTDIITACGALHYVARQKNIQQAKYHCCKVPR